MIPLFYYVVYFECHVIGGDQVHSQHTYSVIIFLHGLDSTQTVIRLVKESLP